MEHCLIEGMGRRNDMRNGLDFSTGNTVLVNVTFYEVRIPLICKTGGYTMAAFDCVFKNSLHHATYYSVVVRIQFTRCSVLEDRRLDYNVIYTSASGSEMRFQCMLRATLQVSIGQTYPTTVLPVKTRTTLPASTFIVGTLTITESVLMSATAPGTFPHHTPPHNHISPAILQDHLNRFIPITIIQLLPL
jgi:hypothetical protein